MIIPDSIGNCAHFDINITIFYMATYIYVFSSVSSESSIRLDYKPIHYLVVPSLAPSRHRGDTAETWDPRSRPHDNCSLRGVQVLHSCSFVGFVFESSSVDPRKISLRSLGTAVVTAILLLPVLAHG